MLWAYYGYLGARALPGTDTGIIVPPPVYFSALIKELLEGGAFSLTTPVLPTMLTTIPTKHAFTRHFEGAMLMAYHRTFSGLPPVLKMREIPLGAEGFGKC